MKNKRERIVFMLMGLVLGFALGASILFWKQSLNWTYRILDKGREFLVSLFDSKEYEEPQKVISNNNNKKKQKNKSSDDSSDNNAIDTTTAYYSDYEINPDDTLSYNEYSQFYEDAVNDDEPVLRDRMLVKKQIEAKQLTKQSQQQGTNLDSLLIGGKAPKEEKHIFSVELWESPLNYKGYKRNRSQVILYGIKNFEQFKLKLLKNDLYMDFADNFYQLENTDDFKNLIPINNQQLISQLKEK